MKVIYPKYLTKMPTMFGVSINEIFIIATITTLSVFVGVKSIYILMISLVGLVIYRFLKNKIDSHSIVLNRYKKRQIDLFLLIKEDL